MKITRIETEVVTLDEVQQDVEKQLQEDYGDRPIDMVRQILLTGLAEETGEVLGLRKRELRGYEKDKGAWDRYPDELGDVLWYLTACCFAFGTSLEEIWEYNKKKLNERGWRHGRSES